MVSTNAKERTLNQFTALFDASGWKLLEVKRSADSKIFWPCIIAEIA